MFDNRKDPMIDTVQKVMVENARRRQIEADLNEELGIQDRKQLGHEKHYLYDQALSQRINEAELSPKQKSLAAIGGNPEKIDASDFDKLRDMKNEANEEPPGPFDPIMIPDRIPFDPDPRRKKRPDEPKTARGLAKQAMRDMMKKMKADKAKPKQNMEEEQIDEDLSLESIQEEIRNNLLERANRLLENGSQDQIVEFMNDLTLEQRSILNIQERLKLNPALNFKTGVVSQAKIPSAAAPPKPPGAANDNLKPPAAPAAPPSGITRRDIVAGAVGAGATAATLGNSDTKAQAPPAATSAGPASRAPVGDQERSDADNNSNNKLTAAKPAGTPRAAASSAPRASAPRASAPAAARPEIRRTGVDGTESAQDFNYNQASGAYNEPKAAAAPRVARAAAKPATAAAKPAAAATSAPRRGSDIGSPVAGGDDRLVPELERLGDTKHHNSQDAAANLAGLQKSAKDSAEKTADAFGPGTQTAKSAAAKPVADPREGGSSSGRGDPNISESRNFERFLRNR